MPCHVNLLIERGLFFGTGYEQRGQGSLKATASAAVGVTILRSKMVGPRRP
jgi:hypothetical protein